jgi:hypothetical protein
MDGVIVFDKIQVRAVSAGCGRFGQEREKLEQKRKTRCAAGGFSEGQSYSTSPEPGRQDN